MTSKRSLMIPATRGGYLKTMPSFSFHSPPHDEMDGWVSRERFFLLSGRRKWIAPACLTRRDLWGLIESYYYVPPLLK
ncbi:MAG: hypothetical protein Q6365_002880 [Candidatus Sigynarchaeota archaeon]